MTQTTTTTSGGPRPARWLDLEPIVTACQWAADQAGQPPGCQLSWTTDGLVVGMSSRPAHAAALPVLRALGYHARPHQVPAEPDRPAWLRVDGWDPAGLRARAERAEGHVRDLERDHGLIADAALARYRVGRDAGLGREHATGSAIAGARAELAARWRPEPGLPPVGVSAADLAQATGPVRDLLIRADAADRTALDLTAGHSDWRTGEAVIDSYHEHIDVRGHHPDRAAALALADVREGNAATHRLAVDQAQATADTERWTLTGSPLARHGRPGRHDDDLTAAASDTDTSRRDAEPSATDNRPGRYDGPGTSASTPTRHRDAEPSGTDLCEVSEGNAAAHRLAVDNAHAAADPGGWAGIGSLLARHGRPGRYDDDLTAAISGEDAISGPAVASDNDASHRHDGPRGAGGQPGRDAERAGSFDRPTGPVGGDLSGTIARASLAVTRARRAVADATAQLDHSPHPATAAADTRDDDRAAEQTR